MDIILLIAFIISLFVGIFLLFLNLSIREAYEKGKRYATKVATDLEKAAESINVIGRVIKYTEVIIQKSNIRLYADYNVLTHLIVCAVLSLVAFRWISRYMPLAACLAFSAITSLTPYIVLQAISEHFEKVEKKNAVDFLILVKNCLINSKNDIFKAFKDSSEYTIIEPLKSFLAIISYEHDHKVNPFTCFNNFKEKINTPVLKIYIYNLSICYQQGGNIVELTQASIDELSDQGRVDDAQDTEDHMQNFGLYILLLLNFAIIYWILNSSYKKEILGSLWGEVVYILDMMVSGYIMFMSMKRGGE